MIKKAYVFVHNFINYNMGSELNEKNIIHKALEKRERGKTMMRDISNWGRRGM